MRECRAHEGAARVVYTNDSPYDGQAKGWLDTDGKLHEKVYDVAWSGDRKPGENGKVPSVGNTVDIENATWTNSIGESELIAVWKDPDFDPKQPAFYYGRVIEIPTPRWTAYDVKRLGVKPLPGTRMVLQERAWARQAPAYGIGTVSAFWLIDRINGFW